MNETLMDRAISYFEMAEYNFKANRYDEVHLNITGYLLQQSLELAIKHVLEVKSIKYPFTHDLVNLVDILPDCIKSRFDFNTLTLLSTVTQWESKTRYIKNFRLTRTQLESSFGPIENLLCMLKNIAYDLELGTFEKGLCNESNHCSKHTDNDSPIDKLKKQASKR